MRLAVSLLAVLGFGVALRASATEGWSFVETASSLSCADSEPVPCEVGEFNILQTGHSLDFEAPIRVQCGNAEFVLRRGLSATVSEVRADGVNLISSVRIGRLPLTLHHAAHPVNYAHPRIRLILRQNVEADGRLCGLSLYFNKPYY